MSFAGSVSLMVGACCTHWSHDKTMILYSELQYGSCAIDGNVGSRMRLQCLHIHLRCDRLRCGLGEAHSLLCMPTLIMI